MQPGEQPTNLAGFGLGAGIAAGSGFLPYKGGRLWDKYVAGARAIESAFPSAILRTFRISESLSPLESYKKVSVSPEAFKRSGKYGEFFKNTFGPGIDRISLTGNGNVFGRITGKGNQAIGEGIQILAGTQKGLSVADFYARITGTNLSLEGVAGATRTESLNDSLLRAKYHEYRQGIISQLVDNTTKREPILSFSQWKENLSPLERQQRLILSAPYRDSIKLAGKNIKIPQQYQKALARAEVTTNFLRAKAAVTTSRLNTLLSQPLELPVLRETVGKLPFIKHLPVKPGTSSQMLARYVGKGIAVGAAWKGLEYIDYLRAEGNQAQATASSTLGGAALGAFIFQKAGQRLNTKGAVAGAILGLAASVAPRFDQGVFSGAASFYTDAQISRAKVSETLGVSDALRRQEEIAPGLNSLGAAIGFGGVGALTLGATDYFSFLASGIDKSLKEKTLPAWAMFDKERLARKTRIGDRIWESHLGQKITKTNIGKSLSKLKSPMGIGFLGGLAVWGAVNAITGIVSGNPIGAIPGSGIIGTTDTPEELEAIYSGEKEIAVRKGRWWEAGRSSKYEGSQISYFRQHAIARLNKRAYQKGLYGDESEKWEHDPILNPLKTLFGSDEWKYAYEQKHQYDRGAPLTSTVGEDIPFIGPAIAATFGKLIKPRKAVRPNEWNLGDGVYAEEKDLREEQIPAYELGGIGPGAPVGPEESTQLLNKLNYRRREAVGLVGFAEASMQKALTGREEAFQNLQTIGTMGKETSSEAWLWKHLNVGGALAASETVRRFIPRTPSYLDTYNPLKNDQPWWMPKDYFMPLNFDTVPEAEIRFAGEGYCLHPDTKIETDNGYIPIKDIKIGDNVLTSKGYQKVKRCFNRNYNGNLISIKSYGGLNEATVLTPEHEVKGIRIKKCKYYKFSKNKKRHPCKLSKFCYKMKCNDFEQNTIEWIQAQDLREGDYVLRPENKILNTDRYKINIDEIIKNFNIKRIDSSTYQLYRPYRNKIIKGRQIKLNLKDSNELWFIFGLYLAEGSLKKAGVSFALHKNETYLFDFIKNLFPNAKTYLKEKNGRVVDINNKILKIIIENLFGRAKEKTIPKKLNEDQFIALFSGLIQGDGYKSKECLTLSISPIYEKLLNSLIYYCNIFNIQYSLTKRKTRKEYTFKILASSVQKLTLLNHKKIISSESKTISDFSIENYRAFKIKKIDIIKYDGIVHDIEVNNIHEYCSSFIVHNSALNPEVQGIDPNKYPLIHRLKILGDVAFWSDEYKETLAQARNTRLSKEHQTMLETIVDQVKQKKIRKEFNNYRFNEDLLTTQKVTVKKVISPREILTEEYGEVPVSLKGIGAVKDTQAATDFLRDSLEGSQITIQTPSLQSRAYGSSGKLRAVGMLNGSDIGQVLESKGYAQSAKLEDEFEQIRFSPMERLAGKFAEKAMHGVDTPLESLTPFSPASKFIRKRSAIEEYIKSEAIGTSSAFWDKPIENFISPTINTAAYQLGLTDIPKAVQEKRDLNEYWDMIKWVKAQKLGDQEMASETVFGADAFSKPPRRSLPRPERDYFAEFSAAQTEEDRAQILNLIPENERRIYISQWMRQEEAASRAKIRAKIDTDYDNQVVATTKALRKSEGFAYTEDLEEQWMNETGGQIPYDDWIRDKKAKEYFSTHSLPGADWLGFCVPPWQQIKVSCTATIDMKDIQPYDKVKTFKGENVIMQKFNRNVNEKLIELSVYHNTMDTMTATKNHKILAIKGKACPYNLHNYSICTNQSKHWRCHFCKYDYYKQYKLEWILMDQVDKNTFLPIPYLKHSKTNLIVDMAKLNCFPENTIIDTETMYPKSGMRKPMNRYLIIDEAIGWLIGYYLAEGNVWKAKDRLRGVQFSANLDTEIPILELTQKIIKQRFGLDSIIRVKKNTKCAYLVVANQMFASIIDYWCGRYCDKKYLPEWTEHVTKETQEAILEGIWTGDGAKNKRETIGITNKEVNYFAKQVYERQKNPVSLRLLTKKNYKNIYLIEKLTNTNNVLIHDDFIAYRVSDIKEIDYKGPVYDLEINEEHNYSCCIGIFHNSPAADLEDFRLKDVQMRGLNPFEFDLWQDRQKSLAQKPYVSEEAILQMQAEEDYDKLSRTFLNAKSLGKILGDKYSNVQMSKINANTDEKYNITIRDKRQKMIDGAYKQLGA